MRRRSIIVNGRGSEGGWLRLPEGSATDAAVKPAPYLPIYEQLLGFMRDEAFTLLELGVWGGHSLQMWRDAFPRATIVGIDLAPPEVALGPRVHVIQGDQADPELMQRVRNELAPHGFDVIVDDASHIGITTARSLQVLYENHLRAGGIYVIEDWGTGYLPDWQDGGRMASSLDAEQLDSGSTALELGSPQPIHMPSHDVGAVGVVKRLIDHVAAGTVRYAQPDVVAAPLAIESMTVWDGIVVLRKPAD
ncbi:MAG TPA: class I SAM-dependent methyltransferase [Solirubrobacteraceae bacterium]|nr:class I SAM-dependent methyltransferase [Solirubrobacteraceae bacterium]